MKSRYSRHSRHSRRRIRCSSIMTRIFFIYLLTFPHVKNERQRKIIPCTSITTCDECIHRTDCVWYLEENTKGKCLPPDNFTDIVVTERTAIGKICVTKNFFYSRNSEYNKTCEELNVEDGFKIREYLCIGIYIVIFTFGLLGNTAVIYVVFTYRRMKTPTNVLIANLACADLLVIIFCLPVQLYNNLFLEWKFGHLLCSLVPYMQGVSVCASIFILMAISVERCLTICHPMTRHGRNTIPAYVILIIWIFPFLIPMPWLFYFKVQPWEKDARIDVCLESWPNVDIGNVYFVAANILLCYILPLAVISVCFYCIWRRVSTRVLPGENVVQSNAVINRSKIKVTKMMLIVTILFTSSWFPLYLIFAMIKFGHASDTLVALVPYAQWLGVSNSCVNPILYTFYNKNFRTSFKAILVGEKWCPFGQKYLSSSSSRTGVPILANQKFSQSKLSNTQGDIVTIISEKSNHNLTRTMSTQVSMNSCVLIKAQLLRGRSLDYA